MAAPLAKDILQALPHSPPQLLFRVSHSASHVDRSTSHIPPTDTPVSSQISRFGRGFRARSPTPAASLPIDSFRARLSDHLNWTITRPSPFISTTSSLLKSLLYARWQCLQGRHDTSITLLDGRRLVPGSVYAASALLRAFEVERNGRPWHDAPEGEYLVLNEVPEGAWRGVCSYQGVSAEVEVLLPELADKPYQLLGGEAIV
ncbi:MAG: hypothetical protein Q9195_006334 [Heterodermia aff. obscurata]